MLEKIVQIKNLGRFRNFHLIPEAVVPWFLTGEMRIKDAEMMFEGGV